MHCHTVLKPGIKIAANHEAEGSLQSELVLSNIVVVEKTSFDYVLMWDS